MAMELDLEIIPVINKIDLPSADIDACLQQIDHDLGLDSDLTALVSAKTGQGIEDLFETIVKHIPAPKGDPKEPLRALIFDSHYDAYRGVVVHFRIFDGTIKVGQELKLFSTGAIHTVEEVGVFKMGLVKTNALSAGDVGYFIAGIKLSVISESGYRYRCFKAVKIHYLVLKKLNRLFSLNISS